MSVIRLLFTLIVRRLGLLLLLTPLLLPAAVAMTRSEAIRELGLPRTGNITPQQLKAAYRKRSLETHPDKGGSDEAFVRVAEAYEELSASGGSERTFRRHGGDAGSGMSTEDMADRMRKAEEMFDDMFDSLFDESTVGDAVDSLFAQFGGENQKLGIMGKMFKSFIKWAAPKFMKLLESDGATITVNGQSMSGADFKEWRAQRRARRDDRIAGQKTDL